MTSIKSRMVKELLYGTKLNTIVHSCRTITIENVVVKNRYKIQKLEPTLVDLKPLLKMSALRLIMEAPKYSGMDLKITLKQALELVALAKGER